MCRKLGGPQRRSGRVGKISPPTWFDPQAVDSVAGHLTVVLLKIPIVLGGDTLLFGHNFPTFRKIAFISFSNGIHGIEDTTENSESVRLIMECLLTKPSNFQKYIYCNRTIINALIILSISYKIGNLLHYVITMCCVVLCCVVFHKQLLILYVNFSTFSIYYSVLVNQNFYNSLHNLETKENLTSFPFYIFNFFLHFISGVDDVRKFPPSAYFEFSL